MERKPEQVLVTRAERQGSALAEALRARGLAPVVVPTIETVPPDSYAALDAALARLSTFDWLLFTSANAVDVFRQRMPAVGELPRVAAIGVATARALHGVSAGDVLVPPVAVAESLAEMLLPFARRREQFLLVRAETAREVLPETLRRAGGVVEVATAYRTVVPAASVALLREMAAAGEWPAVATFTSASTVVNLAALLQTAGVDMPRTVARVSIGPITSTALREAGWFVSAEATEASVAGLVEAVLRVVG